MKKMLTIATLLAVTMTAFAGCGGMSQEKLDANADTLYDAAVTAVSEMDSEAKELTVGTIDSDGKAGSNDDFTAKMIKYFPALKEEPFEWVVSLNENGSGIFVEYVCIAESYDSERLGVIGAPHGGASLNQITENARKQAEAEFVSEEELPGILEKIRDSIAPDGKLTVDLGKNEFFATNFPIKIVAEYDESFDANSECYKAIQEIIDEKKVYWCVVNDEKNGAYIACAVKPDKGQAVVYSPLDDEEYNDTLRGVLIDFVLSANDNNPSTPSKTGTPVATIVNAYDENEVGADQKYLNKNITITGIVVKVDKDIRGEAYVAIGNKSGAYDYVKCYFTNANVIANLHSGDEITISGTCIGKYGLYPSLENCKIEK